MAYSAITQPHEYMAAYSAVPLKLYSDDYNVSDNYKYLVNIFYNKVRINAATSYVLNNNVQTKLTSVDSIEFNEGDYILLNDEDNANLYTGYYIITKIIDANNFVIDLVLTQPFGGNTALAGNFIRYKFSPDLDGYAKMDLSTVLKDFVSQNLTGEDVNYALEYEGPDTVFEYDLLCGAESNYKVNFEDNIFSGGSVGFYNSAITSLANIPFQVGDQINVVQDIYGWDYIDNLFSTGLVGFTGSTTMPFAVGQNITVTGQETYPYYNGPTAISSTGTTTQMLVTDKSWQGSSPVEGGTIYGVPKPEYNGVATIQAIFIDPTYGLVIMTNKPFTGNSPAIPGQIGYAYNRKVLQPNLLKIENLKVYNSHLNKNEYSIDGFDSYVIQSNGMSTDYNISTILGVENKYRIEPSTIGFLLTHQESSGLTTGMGYEFFDSSNNQLGMLLLTGSTTWEDYYSPIGIDQLNEVTEYYDFGTPFSSYTSSIDSYCLFASNDCECNCLDINLVFKPGQGTNTTVSVCKEDGLINGENYWLFEINGQPAQLAYLPEPSIEDGWYITETGVTQYSAVTTFYAFDKLNDTDCPASDTWSTPIASPLSGGTGIGTSVERDVLACMTQKTNKVCFKLNDDCSRYQIYHLMWKDKNGSFISYPFKYISRDNIEAERKNYYKQEGTWKNDTFGYEDYGRGEKDFYVRSRKSIILNSGWLYEFERDLMEDLIQSPSVYIQTPENRLFAGRLEEKKIEIYKQVNDELFSYSFNFIFSSNENRF